ncbi:MAG: tyrosine-type recombinase/integrase [Thermodesulfobacteriota bacterium]|jgi:site-specific recombinase XerD
MKMDYLTEFLDYLKYQRGLSENTLQSYEWDLKIFFKWANDRELKVEQVKIKDIDSFLIWLRKNGNCIGTANRRAYCLKSFFRWLLRIEVIDRNPLDLFEQIKAPKLLPKYLTKEQQESLLETAKNGKNKLAWAKKRNYLMFLFLIDTGLRIGELCSIKPTDIDLSGGILRVCGKGSKEREVVLSDRVRKVLGEYLDAIRVIDFDGQVAGPGLASRGFNLKTVTAEFGISHSMAKNAIRGNSRETLARLRAFVKDKIQALPVPWLFFNRRGKQLCQRHAFLVIKRIGRKAGIEGLYPHLLRHTFATNLRRRGADLLLMREALGHASVSTTQIYAHVGNEEYKSQLRNLVNQN